MLDPGCQSVAGFSLLKLDFRLAEDRNHSIFSRLFVGLSFALGESLLV